LPGREAVPQDPKGAASAAALPVPPIVAQVEALVRAGKPTEAVLVAYRTAEEDVRRAFALTLPKQWTHREFVRRYLRADMGYVAVLLPQLHAIFEPVRYGGSSDVPLPVVTDLLRSLYHETALRRFLPARIGPGAAGPSPPTFSVVEKNP